MGESGRIEQMVFDPARERLYILRKRPYSFCVYESVNGVWTECQRNDLPLVMTFAIDGEGRAFVKGPGGPCRRTCLHITDTDSWAPGSIFKPFNEDGPEGVLSTYLLSMCHDPSRGGRILLTDGSKKIKVLKAHDLSFVGLVEIPGIHGTSATLCLHVKAVDAALDRVVCVSRRNKQVLVLSLEDFSVVLDIGRYSPIVCAFRCITAICVDNQSRMIIADSHNLRLVALTSDGVRIGDYRLQAEPCEVAFDRNTGVIAYSTGQVPCFIPANTWLPGTFVWAPDAHRHAPLATRVAVSTLTGIRSLVESPLSLIPNELLFLIFEHL